jgi:hypothetical protein
LKQNEDRREPGEVDEYAKEFGKKIRAIEKKHLPKPATMKKDPVRYKKQYLTGQYRKEIQKVCKEAMDWIAPGKRSSLNYANNLISMLRGQIADLDSPNLLLQHEIDQLKKKYPQIEILQSLDVEKNGRKQTSADIRKIYTTAGMPDPLVRKLKTLPKNHLVYKFVKFTPAQKAAYSAGITESQKRKHEKSIVLPMNRIVKMSLKIIKNRSKEDWRALTCAVCALTGRRPIEVIFLATYFPSEKPGHLWGNRAKTEDPEPIEFPVIEALPEDIIDAVHKLRALKKFTDDGKEISLNDIASRTSRYLIDHLRAHYAIEKIKVRHLRYGYMAWADEHFYKKLGIPEGLTKPAYFSQILGHIKGDFETQLKYAGAIATWDEFSAKHETELAPEQTRIRESIKEKYRTQRLAKMKSNPEKYEKKKQEARGEKEALLETLEKKVCKALLERVEAAREKFFEEKPRKRMDVYHKFYDFVTDYLRQGIFINRNDMETKDAEGGFYRGVVDDLIACVGLPPDPPREKATKRKITKEKAPWPRTVSTAAKKLGITQ